MRVEPLVLTRVDPWLKHSERPAGTKVTTVVLHHDASSSALGTIRYLARPLVFASYHTLFERDGHGYKCVPLSKKAWHAGLSNGPDGRNVNAYSVGVCFSNRGNGEPYPEAQIMAAAEYIRFELPKQFPDLKWITTHRLITRRKIDPFAFDFTHFADGMVGPQLLTWMDERLGRKWNG